MKMHIFLLHYHDGHVPLVPQHTPTLFYQVFGVQLLARLSP